MKRAIFPVLAVLGATLVTMAWRGPPPGGAWRLLLVVIGFGMLALVGALLIIQRLVPEQRRLRDGDDEGADAARRDADQGRSAGRPGPAAVEPREVSVRPRPICADLQSSTDEDPREGPPRARPRPPAARRLDRHPASR